MDLPKAQRLLIKIQAFLDNGNGNELSRLEKDLMKSYILQLYDAVSSDEPQVQVEKPKQAEMPPPRVQFVEPPVVHIPEPPVVNIPEPVKHVPEKPVYVEYVAPKIPEIPVEIKVPVYEPVAVIPKPDYVPVVSSVVEPVAEVIQKPKPVTFPVEAPVELASLFELPNADDVSGRFSHFPIANIESALGLNERIFTLNELFGGDRVLFETTCAELNNLGSYREATALLLQGAARQYKWSDPERIKMAEHFIRIVARRYPKT
jgi:hypothetical protein